MASTLQDLLISRFGFESFRPGQRESIEALLDGRDALVVMPTGAGKSLVFQLVSTLLDGITLVISPLIALMQDQVSTLNRLGIAATFINSSIPVSEQKLRIIGLRQGRYKLIYIAPERLRSLEFMEALSTQRVALLAVDEAHCISEWGHDFRPDYLHIARASQSIGKPLTVSLTATATPQVQADIGRLLRLRESYTRIVTGFNRPNLTLFVEYTNGVNIKLKKLRRLFDSSEKGARIVYTGTRRDAEEIADFISSVINLPAVFYHAGLPAEDRARIQNAFLDGDNDVIVATNAFGMGIDRADVRQVIHFSLPGSLEAYYQEAGRAGRDGEPARVTLLYDPHDRALQEYFIASSAVSAPDLNAINNSIWRANLAPPAQSNRTAMETVTTLDVISDRTGLHPVQIKVGISILERAGALQHLGDAGTRMFFRQGSWDAHKIATAIQEEAVHTNLRRSHLEQMIRYAETNDCRRKTILNHFGDHGPADAQDCCDNCKSRKTMEQDVGLPARVVPPTHVTARPAEPGDSPTSELPLEARLALIILDCIQRTRPRLGKQKIAQILHGSKARQIQNNHYDRNTYYARLAAIQQGHLEIFIDQLEDLGYLKTIGGEYPVLALTPAGEQALKYKQQLNLTLPAGLTLETIERKKEQVEAGGTVEYTAKLFRSGCSPEDIAKKRNLSLTTIYGHLERLLSQGQIGLAQIMPQELINQIQGAIEKIGSTDSLTPIKMVLPAEIEFGMIRCVVTANRLSSQDKEESGGEIEAYIQKSHPRQLRGAWNAGWSLGFHSRFSGDVWSRSRVGELAYRLKYESDSSVLPELVDLAVELLNLRPELREVDAILPVPSTTNRTFDPVRAFCQALSVRIKIPVIPAITKTRLTRPQKELKTLAQKHNNVAGAFAVSCNLPGTRCLLVDDLYDSGETLNEIARILTHKGMPSVSVLTLTSTIHSDA